MKFNRNGIVVGIIVIVIIICFLPWQHKINKTLNGIEYKIGDDEYNEKITITMKGKYKQYLIKNDRFDGVISISKNGELWNESYGEIEFNDNMADMVSPNRDGKEPFIGEMFGRLLCDAKFKEILILTFDKSGNGYSWDGSNGLYISIPATNRKESIKIAKKLSAKNEWIFNAVWE